MRSFIYKFLSKIDKFTGSSADNRLRVLAYHTVPDQTAFEKQLEFISYNYNVIGISELKDHFINSTPLPTKPLLITFDDGDISVYENGLPALQAYNFPAVLFIITGLINTSKLFWCRHVEVVYKKNGASYAEARAKVGELKSISNYERTAYLDSLEEIQARQLSVKELHSLEKGNVIAANHTHTHPMVDKCTKKEIEQELKHSRIKFKEWELEGYSVFAYPNGNWDVQTENILEDEGVEMAFLFDHKINKKNMNPMRISRIRVDTDLELNEFKVKVSGLHINLMLLRQKIGQKQ
ncbi:Polysaccharide deacetylase [Salegentibacter echinorum]|uniref:Polysaccharide deacetylase n=1 Tax=Salegentibacter echinorum TaxID=1073325 RepID=A0A1M5FIL0_SALEC|nr:polysaccharide deacetylase family protein [Salegentibacter echinorum]SHF91326.1 Polysaccharide deacetylase [Salegentibacter echinorum]